LGAAAVVAALQFKTLATMVLALMAGAAVAIAKALQAAMVQLIAVVAVAAAMTEAIQPEVLAALSCVIQTQKQQLLQQPAVRQSLFLVVIGLMISQVQGALPSDGTLCTS
jgi:hypothetical protein